MNYVNSYLKFNLKYGFINSLIVIHCYVIFNQQLYTFLNRT